MAADDLTPETIALAQQLFDWARENNAAQLEAYLDAGAPVDMVNHNGDTMLTLASYHQATDVVRLLLSRGANIEHANDRGQRALACAVFQQDAVTSRALLAAGADPDAGTPSGRQTAEMFGWDGFAQLLADREKDQ